MSTTTILLLTLAELVGTVLLLGVTVHYQRKSRRLRRDFPTPLTTDITITPEIARKIKKQWLKASPDLPLGE